MFYLDGFVVKSVIYLNCWLIVLVCVFVRMILISGMYLFSIGVEYMCSMVDFFVLFYFYFFYFCNVGYYCMNNSKIDYNVNLLMKVWDELS